MNPVPVKQTKMDEKYPNGRVKTFIFVALLVIVTVLNLAAIRANSKQYLDNNGIRRRPASIDLYKGVDMYEMVEDLSRKISYRAASIFPTDEIIMNKTIRPTKSIYEFPMMNNSKMVPTRKMIKGRNLKKDKKKEEKGHKKLKETKEKDDEEKTDMEKEDKEIEKDEKDMYEEKNETDKEFDEASKEKPMKMSQAPTGSPSISRSIKPILSLLNKLDDFDEGKQSASSVGESKSVHNVSLSPFQIEFNRNVSETIVRESISEYLETTMILNVDGGEFIQLIGSPKSVTTDNFLYRGYIGFLEESSKAQNKSSDKLDDASILLVKQRLALQDQSALENAIQQGVDRKANGSSSSTSDSQMIQITFLKILGTDTNSNIISNSDKDQKSENENEVEANAKSEDNSNNEIFDRTDETDSVPRDSASVKAEDKALQEENKFLHFFHSLGNGTSDLVDDLDLSSTESILILCGIAVGALSLFVLLLCSCCYCYYRRRYDPNNKKILDMKRIETSPNDEDDAYSDIKSIQDDTKNCLAFNRKNVHCLEDESEIIQENSPSRSCLMSLQSAISRISPPQIIIENPYISKNGGGGNKEVSTNELVFSNTGLESPSLKNMEILVSSENDNYWDQLSLNGSSIVSVS